MDLELNDIQQELASTLGKYLRTEYDAAAREAIQPVCSATGVTAVKPPQAVRRAPCWMAPLDQLTTPAIR